MPGLILAVVNPDNTPHGYNWTFAFPMILFLVIIAVLYVLFTRPHRRVPPRAISPSAVSAGPPEAEAARAASVAGGLSLAAGGGVTESHHEPTGAHLVAGAPDETAGEQAGEQGESTAEGEPGSGPGADSKETE